MTSKPKVPITDNLISAAAAEHLPMSEDHAKDRGKRELEDMTVQMGLPQATEWYVIQHGAQAFRDEEPAKIIGFTNFNPTTKRPMFCAVIAYADSGPYYVDMSLPRYRMGTHPPLLFTRRVEDDDEQLDGAAADEDDDGAPRSHVERPADRQHWLELVPANCVRKSYKVKG